MKIYLIKEIIEDHMGWSDLDKCAIYQSTPNISVNILDKCYFSYKEAKAHKPQEKHSRYVTYRYEIFSREADTKINLNNKWIKIDKKHPLPCGEVLGYNKEWVEVDFNPKGVRIGYLTEEGNFISAKYEPDGGDDRGDIEGYRQNLPTHYMEISVDTINNSKL